ncbi:class I SAM-dependent methyltransferase [Kaarinaea lacus]
MSQLNSIAVCCSHKYLENQAKALAQQLAIPLLDHKPQTSQYKFLLVYSQNASDFELELHFPTENLNPIKVDFNDQQLLYRQKFGGGRQQAIGKAVGLKRGYIPNLLDGTAGLGKDAFILASLNCKVTMCERNPIIHALLADGLRRLQVEKNANSQNTLHLSLNFEKTQNYLKNNPQNIDVIYLDPMYPHRTKSALVKKEMRILRNLVGDDSDFDSVLETALKTATQRVVVKRPKTAPPIGAIPPSHSIESKKTRFDVYLTRQPG